MTITQIKYVLSVNKHRNFTIAAEKCFVTQPTLSMQIQKLEEELGVKIFNRKKKPIELTEIGSKIVIQAKSILDEANRMQDIIDQHKGYIGGEFKLGIIPTVAPTLLPLFLKTFIKSYPEIQLIVEENTTDQLIKKLKNNQIDCAIAATPLQDENLKEIVLYFEPFVGYLNENHPSLPKKQITLSDIESDTILLLNDGHCFRNSVINLCKNKTDHNQTFYLESGSFETLTRLVDQNIGITLLPHLHGLKTEHQNRIKPFKDPKPAREISLIYPKNELKMQLIKVLQNTISSAIKGSMSFYDIKIVSPLKK